MDDLDILKSIMRVTQGASLSDANAVVAKVRAILLEADTAKQAARKETQGHDRVQRSGRDRSR